MHGNIWGAEVAPGGWSSSKTLCFPHLTCFLTFEGILLAKWDPGLAYAQVHFSSARRWSAGEGGSQAAQTYLPSGASI